MNKKEQDYLNHLAISDLTTYHYKILLLLNVKSKNQAQLANELDIHKQNINKYIKELQNMNLIEIDRIEGRNKFYRAVTNLEKIKLNIPGQTTLKGV